MTSVDFLSKQVDRFDYYYLDLTAEADGPLAVVCGGWERCSQDYVMNRKGFRYHSVEYVAEGYGELYREGIHTQLMPGSVFSYGPGVSHRIVNDPSRPMLKYFVDFTGSVAADLLTRSGLDAGSLLVSRPERLRTILDELQQSAHAATPRSPELAVHLLQAFVLLADTLRLSGRTAQAGAAATFERCRKVIDDDYLSLKGLADIAERCLLDAATICRLFKRFGTVTPYEHLIRRKMNHAAARLQSTSIQVNELAEEMGFSDAFHFSRTFKRVHGLSPRAFRERIRLSSA